MNVLNGGPASTSPLSDLQQLVEQSLEMMACYGHDHRYIAVSPALTTLFQCSSDTLLGQTNAALAQAAINQTAFPKALTGCQDYWRQTEDAIASVIQNGKAERRIQALPTTDGVKGKSQLHNVTYTPLRNAQGQIYQILSISRPTLQSQQIKTLESDENQALPQPKSIVGIEMPGLEAASLANLVAISPDPARRQSTEALHTDTPPPHPSETFTQDKRFSIKSPQKESHSVHEMAEFLQLVLDNIPQYIFWKDRNSVYLGCNHRWAKMAGIDNPTQVVGITDNDLPWTQDQKDWYLECDQRVMETDTPMLRIKQSQRQADGQLSWRETSKLPLHDVSGNVVGLLGTIEDITERKIAEDLLKQSEETFRKLAKQEELLNQISGQIRQSLKLETIQQTTVEQVRQFFETDRVLIYRFEENWNGQVIVESVVEPWESTLGSVGMNSQFHQQHTDLYRQGQIQTIADIETADLDSQHQQYLKSLQVRANLIVPILVQDQLWGLLIAHQCTGPRHWESQEIDLLQALAGQVGVAIQQAELYAQAQRSATMAQDKAEQLEVAIQNLQQTQTQLIQTEKMSSLGQMVAGIAHEINNPVTFIHSNIQPLQDYIQDLLHLLSLYRQHYSTPVAEISEVIEEIDLDFLLEDLEKILQSFHVGSSRIRQIVLSLRTFSRLDEADQKEIDIHEGLESTILILQHCLKATPCREEICIRKHYGNLPLVECYPSQLNQVFMNIINNAVDAMDQLLAEGKWGDLTQRPTITISTEQLEQQVSIRIRDNGPGIPQEYLAKLFDPFFTTKPIGKGTGLGLSISHQIITEKHGGQLICRSEPMKGTEFQVIIPLRQ